MDEVGPEVAIGILGVRMFGYVEFREPVVDRARFWPCVWLDAVEVLGFPGFRIAAFERLCEVDLDSEGDRRRTAVKPGQLGEGLAASGEDEHHGPVAATEDAVERLDIDGARLSGLAGVGVNPDPTELLRLSALVDLIVEEFGDGGIIEGDEHLITVLRYEHDVADVQQIARVGDPESADFGDLRWRSESSNRDRGPLYEDSGPLRRSGISGVCEVGAASARSGCHLHRPARRSEPPRRPGTRSTIERCRR